LAAAAAATEESRAEWENSVQSLELGPAHETVAELKLLS
jgi:hypothetical protein